MTAQAKTIAVVGSTPFAWLLAGLLASDHSRAIVLISEPHDVHRLALPPALSVAPITRPETWARLVETTPQSVRRLSRIAPGFTRRTDVVFGARSSSARTALSHIRHMMAGFGYAVEPAHAIPGSAGIKVRDAWAFDRNAFHAAAGSWLSASDVVIHRTGSLTLRRDGSASIDETDIDLIVLAEDLAIARHLPDDELAGFASMTSHVGIHTSPVASQGNGVTIDLDTGATLSRGANGQIIATAHDENGKAIKRIGASMPPNIAPRLAARTGFDTLTSYDGAPVIGFSRRTRMFVIAGLGHLDFVIAPMLARLIAGDASGVEAEWAAAHAADLRQPRADVAEFAGDFGGDL